MLACVWQSYYLRICEKIKTINNAAFSQQFHISRVFRPQLQSSNTRLTRSDSTRVYRPRLDNKRKQLLKDFCMSYCNTIVIINNRINNVLYL